MELHAKDCMEILPGLAADSIGLAISRPPLDPEHSDAFEYWAPIWFRELYRVIQPGRRVVWCVENAEYDRVLVPFVAASVNHARAAGWLLWEEVVWFDQQHPMRFTHGSFNNGPSVRTKHALHHLLVFQKGPAIHSSNYMDDRDRRFNVMDRAFYRDYVATPTWSVASTPPQYETGSLPDKVAEACVRMWSKPGETVLDPFARLGTVLCAALQWRREAIGCEPNPDLYAQARLAVETRQRAIFKEELEASALGVDL